MSSRRRRWIAGLGIAAFVAAMIGLFFAAGKPMEAFLSDPKALRSWVQEKGWIARLAFMGMMAFQIIVAVIPGEPLEIGAGMAFGVWEGTLLCILGAGLGGLAVFLFVRKLGVKAVETFFSREKIDSMRFMQNSQKLNFWMWLLFLIPGTPKDILTYIAGLTRIRLRTWILITTLGRIPSVITSTLGGDALGGQSYGLAAAVFAGTLTLAGVGLMVYRHVQKNGAA